MIGHCSVQGKIQEDDVIVRMKSKDTNISYQALYGANPVEPTFGWRFDVGWVEPEGVYSPQMRVGVVRSNRADHSNPLRRHLGSVRGGVGDGREAELAGAGAGGAPALPSLSARGRAGGAAGVGGGRRSSAV